MKKKHSVSNDSQDLDSAPLPEFTKEDVNRYIHKFFVNGSSHIPQRRIEESLPEAIHFFNQTRYSTKDKKNRAQELYHNAINDFISELVFEERILITYRSARDGEKLIRIPVIEPFNLAKVKHKPRVRKIRIKNRISNLSFSNSIRKYWSVYLFFCILGFIAVSPYFLPEPIRVEPNDHIKIDYSVWVSDKYKNYDENNPVFDEIIWITVLSVVKNSEQGLALGLYNNLLGKQEGFESEMIWLDICVDEDRDGVDDITGEPALSYGGSDDPYFGVYLIIKFRIIDISYQ